MSNKVEDTLLYSSEVMQSIKVLHFDDIQPWSVNYIYEMIFNLLVKHMELCWKILIMHPT